jgi:hypothetical protein
LPRKRTKESLGCPGATKNSVYALDMVILLFVSWLVASFISYFIFNFKGGKYKEFGILPIKSKVSTIVMHLVLGYFLYSLIFAFFPPSTFE